MGKIAFYPKSKISYHQEIRIIYFGKEWNMLKTFIKKVAAGFAKE